MSLDKEQVSKIAERSLKMLSVLTEQINSQKEEFGADKFHQTHSKASVAKLPKLSKAIVDKTVLEMEEAGYRFCKRKAGSTQVYAMSIENVIDIYAHRQVPRYRDRHQNAFVISVSNLKGGVSKTVSTVSLAHGLRAHPHLLQEDLRILVIDLDPQSSATMFLSHNYAVGAVETTTAQAMLQNVSR